MEEQLHSLAVTHLLQHTLRSLCIHENSQWVYAVFWRILPRNYPPPKWDLPRSIYDRSRGNRRNWILVWEDAFCNFAASCGDQSGTDCETRGDGLQPELFFKMSHEIYNYGEGLIGKVAADHSHKWVFKEPQDQEINFLSSWKNPADYHPRTWEAQFQSGIKTIALIAVREGVVQLGAVNKVVEDLSYVLLLRKKFSYLESIPGVFLPHPSATAAPPPIDPWAAFHHHHLPLPMADMYSSTAHLAQQLRITPSMSSLEALLSKLPSIGTPPMGAPSYDPPMFMSSPPSSYDAPMFMPMERPVVAKEEVVDEESSGGVGCQSSGYYVNVGKPSEGFHDGFH